MTDPIRYDFDMIPMMPGEKRAEFLSLGIVDARLDARVALFRDRQAALALRGAGAPVRDLFSAAGFGMTASGRTVAPGAYRPEEAPARRELLARLHGLILADFDTLRMAEWGVFSLERFLAEAEAARPLAANHSGEVGGPPAWVGRPRRVSQFR